MRRWWLWVFGVFLLVFALRLYFAFQSPFFTSDSAYFHVRLIESLHDGRGFSKDALGMGGRDIIISPVFDGILAVFSLFIPLHLVLKIFPNLFASLLVFPVFLLCRRLTSSVMLSICGALLASIVPGFIANTFNHVSVMTLALPVFFMLLFLWLDIPKRVGFFLGLLIFFVFLHPISLVFVVSIGVYLIFISLDKRASGPELELGLFSIFFAIWAQFVLYKRLILFHGPLVIWQNMPVEVLDSFYSNVTILGAIFQIGAYPLAEGIYALYRTAFRSPEKGIYLLFSVTVVSVLFLWFKLIDVSIGLMLLGITLAVLFSKWSSLLFDFLKRTKFSRFAWLILSVSMVFAFLSTFYPAILLIDSQLKSTISAEEVTALKWLADVSSGQSVIFSPVWYGNYISYFAGRMNVIDNYFFLKKDIDNRYLDVRRVYQTPFETEAVDIFENYGANYLVVPYGVKDIKYGDSHCFKRVYAANIKIYEKDEACSLKVVS